MHAIISIHDVMPHTFSKVQYIIKHLLQKSKINLTLLIVPGYDWEERHIIKLRQLQDSGIILAGHGWCHQTKNISNIYHYLHSALISRNAAEHLSLNETEIFQLIEDCYQWFIDKNLSKPDLYVPPAWALGRISKKKLEQSSFRYFETTTGFIDSKTGQTISLPLVGFEADTTIRKFSLLIFNKINRMLATAKRPLRISIHPDDYDLKLADNINLCINDANLTKKYEDIF